MLENAHTKVAARLIHYLKIHIKQLLESDYQRRGLLFVLKVDTLTCGLNLYLQLITLH
jgi:hypothetical protein